MLYCTPFLLFNGNCAEAMRFYQSCLGGELTLTKTGDTPMKHQFPAEKHNLIINAHLKNGDVEFSATDWHSDMVIPKQGNTFSIFLVSTTYEELKSVFDKLSVGSDHDRKTFIPLQDMPFGTYGQFTDKFGVSWIFKGEKKE
jgi:PhnB protein